jgi:hypothetical protein
MRTFYYVDGKKVDLGTYLNADITNSYKKELVKKAKKYYENNPDTFQRLCKNAPKTEDIGSYLIRFYEFHTEEGRKMSLDFAANRENAIRKQAGYGFLCYAIIILGIIIALIIGAYNE